MKFKTRILTEVRVWVRWGKGLGVEGVGRRRTSRGAGACLYSVWVEVRTQVLTGVNVNWTIPLRLVHFTLCKLYLSKSEMSNNF